MAAPTAKLQFVVPAELTNYPYNPSAESAGNYTAVGTPTLSRDNTISRQVAADSTYSYKLVTGVANQGVQLTTASLPSASLYASAWVYVSSGSPAIRFKINATTLTPTLYETDGAWGWYVTETPFSSGQVSGQTAIQVLDATGSSTFYVDDVTLTSALCRSFHGSYPNCKWNGIAHQSTSLCKRRTDDGKANTKSGGIVYDFDDSTIFLLSSYLGFGLPDIEHQTRDTVDAGKIYQSSQLSARVMALSFTMVASTQALRHSRRATLIDYVQPGDTFVLRYRGNATFRGGSADVQEIECYYQKGLEGNFEAFGHERINLTLTAYDPHFTPATATATSLSMAVSATLSRTLVRTYDSGWSCPGSGPGADIYAITVSPRGHVFAGGDNAVYGWNWATSTWDSIGTLTGGNADCYGLACDPSGAYLYVVGSFTSAGGTSANHIARYTIPTASAGVTGGTWSALGTSAGGAGALIRCVAVAPNGDVYVGGDFTTLNAAAVSATNIGKWSPTTSTWSALGPNSVTGSSTAVHCMSITNKHLYFGGVFDTVGAVGAPTSFTVINTTGSLSSGNWGYCLTSLTGNGESAATSLTASGSGSTGKTLSFTVPSGSTGTNVYREQSAGGGAAQVYYLCTLAAGVNSFTDTGQFTLNTAMEEPSATTAGCQTKRIGRYDLEGNYFSSVGVSGFADGIVRGVAATKDGGNLYMVGTFTAADGATVTRAAQSNGQVISAMGDGLDSDGYAVLIDPKTNEVLVGGSFTTAGSSSACKMVAAWHPGNGTAGKWVHFDLLLPTATVRALTFDHNGELWVVGTFNATGLTSAQTAVTVSGAGGAFLSYPTFFVTGPAILRYIENVTTGHKIWFNMNVVDSEIATIRLKRGAVTMFSTRLNGADRLDGFVDGDLGDLGLTQGVNRVRVFYLTSAGGVPSGNAAVKIVDPGYLLSSDA